MTIRVLNKFFDIEFGSINFDEQNKLVELFQLWVKQFFRLLYFKS